MLGTGVSNEENNPQAALTSVQCYESPVQDVCEGPKRTEQQQEEEEEEEEDAKVPLPARLALSSELLGGEAGLSFAQLYALPDLQSLGMPLSLVSLTGLISGPIALLFLPFMGWFSDRGTDPTRRRALMVIIATAILASGALTIVISNLLYSNVCQSGIPTSTKSPGTTVQTVVASVSSPNGVIMFNQTKCENCIVLGKSINISTSTSSFLPTTTTPVSSSSKTTRNPDSSSSRDQGSSSEAPSQVPPSGCADVVPWIAMLGFVLMELGYDCGMSAIKTWMLTCSPPSGASAALVTGLVMTSLGGMLTAGIGMVDLASVLGFSSDSHSGLPIQTSIQACVVVAMLIVGMTLSLFIGYRVRRQLNLDGKSHPHDPLRKDALTYCDQEMTVDTNDLTGGSFSLVSYQPLATESEDFIESHSDSTADFSSKPKPTEAGLENTAFCENEKNESENVSEKGNDPPKSSEDEKELSARLRKKISVNYGTIEDAGISPHSEPDTVSPRNGLLSKLSTSQEHLLNDDSEESLCLCQSRWSFKATIAILWLSAYFGVGAITMYVLTISDFVGKAIFGGDPAAPPGSDELKSYQDGLRVASYGVLVNYGVYLVFSFLQKKVVSCMGYTIEFVAMSVLLVFALVLLALTEHLATFFLLSAVAGVHKATFHVVPIIVISDLVHKEAKRRGDGKGLQIGGAMSLIVAALPAAYCSLYPWVGAVLDRTGVLATPLLVAAVYASLSAGFFFVLGI